MNKNIYKTVYVQICIYIKLYIYNFIYTKKVTYSTFFEIKLPDAKVFLFIC